MLDSELATISQNLGTPDLVLGMRANYGTGIIPSLFGAELFEMPKSTNTLPTTRSWNDRDRIREMLEQGAPNLRCGRGDHYIESLCEIEKLYGINLSQPHLNDMDKIFRRSKRKGKKNRRFKWCTQAFGRI